MKYPSVIGELSTIEACLAGKSLARFGDGELKLMDGQGYFREPGNEKLGAELLDILQNPPRGLIVGVPTMDDEGPKFPGWRRHADRFAKLFNPEVQYYSAFVTRPDSAPWIDCLAYAQQFASLWSGKRVVLLSERRTKIFTLVSRTAKKFRLVPCPHREAYAQIDDFEIALASGKPEIALLSCGPTATCLAARLCRRGIHAIDVGSAAGFLLKLLAEPPLAKKKSLAI